MKTVLEILIAFVLMLVLGAGLLYWKNHKPCPGLPCPADPVQCVTPPPAKAPVVTPHIEKPPVSVQKPVQRAPVYRKVLPGGKLDGKLDCKDVPKVAHLYPKAVVLQYAKDYGLPPAKVEQLRVCLS